MAGRITSDARHIYVAGNVVEMMGIAKRVGGKWNGTEWVFPLFKAPQVEAEFPATYRRTEPFLELLTTGDVISEAYEYKELDPLPPIPLTATGPNLDPWEHQVRAYHFSMYLPRGAMLYMGMATGKSRVLVDYAQNRPGCKLVLITAPVAVLDDDTWVKQFAKYCLKPYRIIQLFNMPVAKRIDVAKAFIKAYANDDSLLVITTNHASFINDKFVEWAERVKWDVFGIDESSKFKENSGAQSKGATRVAKKSERVMLLTGTPNPHSIEDTFAQFRMIDPTVFGSTITEYRAQYCEYVNETLESGRVVPRLVGIKNEEHWRKRFYSLAYHVDRAVLNLPPVQHITRGFTMEPKAWKHYRELSEEYTTALETLDDCEECANTRFAMNLCYLCNGTGSIAGQGCSTCFATGAINDDCPACVKRVSVTNVLAKAMKLHQLTGGWLNGEEIHRGKLQALISILEELDDNEPVVVFARFTKDIDNIRAAGNYLGREVLELSGNLKQTKEWQRGEAPILAAQISSGAMGIDLTRAAYCVYYSVGTSLGDYLQSEARVHRPGQERSVTYYHLVAKGTIDASIRRALRLRQAVLASLMHDSQEGFSEGDDGTDDVGLAARLPA